MSLTLAPDAEKALTGYLSGQADVAPMVAGIYGKTPKSTDGAWVRVTQLDDRTVGGSRSERLHEFYVQFDCYASKAGRNGSQQAEAVLLGRTIRAALVDMPNRSGLGMTVTGVDIRSHSRTPDATVDEPARERVIITALIWAHS